MVRIAGLPYQKGFGGHFHNDNSVAVLRDIPGLALAVPSGAASAPALLRECVRWRPSRDGSASTWSRSRSTTSEICTTRGTDASWRRTHRRRHGTAGSRHSVGLGWCTKDPSPARHLRQRGEDEPARGSPARRTLRSAARSSTCSGSPPSRSLTSSRPPIVIHASSSSTRPARAAASAKASWPPWWTTGTPGGWRASPAVTPTSLWVQRPIMCCSRRTRSSDAFRRSCEVVAAALPILPARSPGGDIQGSRSDRRTLTTPSSQSTISTASQGR